MRRSALTAILATLFSLSAFSQSVRVTRTDGTVVEGGLGGYENGRYRLWVQGRLEEIPEAQILEIVLAEALPPEADVQAPERPKAKAIPCDPSVEEQQATYFPVKLGRTLVYRRGEGDIVEKVLVESVTRQDGAHRVNYRVEEVYRGFSRTRVHSLEIDKDAVILSADGGREPLLRFPLREGDAWTWESGGQMFRRTVQAIDATVEVGSGDRRLRYETCVVVHFTSSSESTGRRVDLTSRSSYAPGVGLVRVEYPDPDMRRYNLELIDIQE